uniref:NADH dehydrogenase subunit 2 n=1 Tax=Bostrychia tenuissima TaxID=196631 RepID=UPI002E7A2DDB|nr:NADH dehydrogenase subunit 2 [Bostrychia tenuissima]WQF69444.1 NADH dehydrogenase subunit 2 [Bostrychia tenuissima]
MTTINFYLNIYPQMTEFFLVMVTCFSTLFGVVYSNSTNKNFPVLMKNMSFLFVQSLMQSLLLMVNFDPIFMMNWSNLLICNSFVFYMKTMITIFMQFWFFSFFKAMNKTLNFEFWILNLLSLMASFFIMQANDLTSMYISVEFLSLIFYVLASFKRDSEFSTEAGTKYFMTGSFSSGTLTFGISLLYSLVGLTNFQDTALFFTGYSYLQDNFVMSGIAMSLVFILTSFLFKLGSAPFHFWTPDVYEGVSTPMVSFFVMVPKLTLISLMTRFFYTVSLDFLVNQTSSFFLTCALLSTLVGTFGALHQKKWKRFIAYSSMSHVSFLLMNVCSMNLNNLNNLMFYLMFYLIMTMSFFIFFTYFNTAKSVTKFRNNRFLSSLSNLNTLNPMASISMSVILFSMAGVPPLVGFFAKFIVLFSAISQGTMILPIFVLFFNCISCFYYIRTMNVMYFSNKFYCTKLPVVSNMPHAASTVLGILIFTMAFANFHFEIFFILINLMCLPFSY